MRDNFGSKMEFFPSVLYIDFIGKVGFRNILGRNKICFKIFKNQLFFKLPEKLKPIELHFGVKSFNNDISSIVNKRDNWYLSYSDSDTV